MGTLKIDKPIRLIELFAGIGSQAKALKRLGADFEHYRICEFDKYAIKSYNAIHGTDFTTSDITEITAKDLGIVDTDKYTYICCYSFPCQDLSLAGKQKLMAKGSGTRSSLLWEVERLLNECEELPQILLMENVTQVHGKKNKEHFDEWVAFLESKGYKNYWKDLNAKNFGIPQNRNRTFMVSVLGDYTYEFPKEFPLELRLKDLLEETVDEKFYLSDAMINRINTTTYTSGKKENRVMSEKGVCRTLCARDYKDPTCVELEPIRLGGIYDTETSKHQAGSIWDKETIAPTVDTMQGGNRQPLVVENVIIGGMQKNQALKTDGVCTCLTSSMGMGGGYVPMHNYSKGSRIRKLTPKECWRLMGFDDADFDKAADVNSNSQLYKQAGNSIVVDVLCYIFGEML